jgi:hypothetical protein
VIFQIDLIINTSMPGEQASRSYNLRRSALMNRVFYITTLSASICLANGLEKLQKDGDFSVLSLQNLN